MGDNRNGGQRRVLVTGAGGSIGQALVGHMMALGDHVIAADRSDDLARASGAPEWLCFDLTDGASMAAAIAHLPQCPDIVIHNAGWTRAETIETLSDEAIVEEIDINLTGIIRLTRHLLGRLGPQGCSFVFISSVNGVQHYGNPAYAAAKAGIIAFAKALAVEGGARAIRANVVCPGSVRTQAWDHRIAADPHVLGKLTPFYPLGRIVTPQEVAEAAAYLAGATGVTGAVLAVDAGLTAGNLSFIDTILRPQS